MLHMAIEIMSRSAVLEVFGDALHYKSHLSVVGNASDAFRELCRSAGRRIGGGVPMASRHLLNSNG